MAVKLEELYHMMFEHHKFVSEYRLSLLRTWGALYVALAGAFVWTQTNLSDFSWIITSLAVGLTLLMWLADRRHRPAIQACKDVAIDIEESMSANIPEKQRYFSQLDKGFSHSCAIDIFAATFSILLLLGTIYLYCHY